jgi:hypothetical protein
MTLKRSCADGGAPNFDRVILPPGVTEAEWRREMEACQNPRLRILLGCLRTISGVLESNTAILNSSPRRLTVFWNTVREVAATIENELAPTIGRASAIPDLESARQAVAASFAHLQLTLLDQIKDLPADPPPGDQQPLRRLLCVAIGQLHAFLQDSFGGLMASDPRARHDADYYLSKEFPRDVEESEWLYTSVMSLDDEYQKVAARRSRLFPAFLEKIAGRRRIPEPAEWAPMESFLRFLATDFTDQIRRVLSLRAIRLTELDLLSHHANEMPVNCRVLLELHEVGGQMMSALAVGEGGSTEATPFTAAASATVSSRLVPHLRGLDDSLRDLGAFIPLWRQGISQRRALAFRSGSGTGATVE